MGSKAACGCLAQADVKMRISQEGLWHQPRGQLGLFYKAAPPTFQIWNPAAGKLLVRPPWPATGKHLVPLESPRGKEGIVTPFMPVGAAFLNHGSQLPNPPAPPGGEVGEVLTESASETFQSWWE